MAGARISRENPGFGWPGLVFLEKSLGLDGQGAYFSRKALIWMAGPRFSGEIRAPGIHSSLFLEKYAPQHRF